MTIIDIEADSQLFRLVGQALSGETIIIAKAGIQVAQITAIAPATFPRRFGSLAGHASIPDDFDSMGASEIEAMFEV
jgi:antitoxin (DNA-binding transcriptional repressor) of toxin-antitoxin stability system